MTAVSDNNDAQCDQEMKRWIREDAAYWRDREARVRRIELQLLRLGINPDDLIDFLEDKGAI